MNLRVSVWTRFQSLGFAAFLLIVAAGLALLFLPLLRQHREIQAEIDRLEREIARQEALEKQYRAEIDALKSDPSHVERVARDKLNLSKPNEIIFRFEPPSVTNTPAARR